MSDWQKTPAKPESEATRKRPEPKDAVVRRDPETGRLQMVFMSQAKAGKIENLNAYLDKVFYPDRMTPEELGTKAFFRIFNHTDCFYCLDTGLVELPVELPWGGAPKTYRYAWQCTCQQYKPKPVGCGLMASVQNLINQGLYQQVCQLGGPDGSGCKLNVKDTRCLKVNCNKKFKKGE